MTETDAVPSGLGRRILGQALPALGVLAAEPLYLLWDTAIIGRLGALPLAGLAVGALILATVSTQLTFLSYGTTSRSARRFGAGDPGGAVVEGVQATWIALAVGGALLALVQGLAGPITRAIAGRAEIAGAAESWLRVAAFGIPLILITMAGNGWLRGVQRPRAPLVFVLVGLGLSTVLCPVLVFGWAGAPELGLVGSAWANLAGQIVSGSLFLGAVVRAAGGGAAGPVAALRPQPALIRAQLVLGRDLIVRSLSFQVCFVSAGAVAARAGAQYVGAHQIAMQLWNFVSLVLDSLAIAAQTLVGAALGSGKVAAARSLGHRVTAWSTLVAVLIATALAAASGVLPHLFTSDPAVLDALRVPWWFLVAMIPIAGVVFALDGVLLGASDAAYLRSATLAAALVGFLPLIWLSYAFGWGLAGIWSGLATFMVLRCLAVVVRFLGHRWERVGTAPA
ncbi:MATE family efflux transporter [Tsukamurella pulmonis]|uniref:Putative efflux protein, MATE family n=1 Tax=Tsukamurella pulmonis TaxID=47312 RepID=A0A1H1E0T1_9ACTN|nr:MATE family efflux transporter [Tsukamurella pulmonis]KXO92125.1 MATE family efflux transporter [Tsukamurella pulmonis]SDQ82327.1 putative efflux protein, MATE family [Tsukamurella pulmonis]SUP21440.1 DNA-damage-inducible SOS response protein [Tsukamurella pulmonis]